MPALHKTPSSEVTGTWTAAEHERFLEAMSLHPRGPWRLITEHVGSRSIKQVQTHAQKYQQKLLRHQRGLRKTKSKVVRAEHRVDSTTVEQFTSGCIVRRSHIQTDASASLSPSPSSASYASTSSTGFSTSLSSMMDILSEAAEETALEMHASLAADVTYNGREYAYDDCALRQTTTTQYPYGSFSCQGQLDSGVEPMPYSYGYSTPPLVWSEPEALALRETLEVLLV